MYMQAMMELGSQLANPFSSALVHFPVAAWLEEYSEKAHLILESRFRRELMGLASPQKSII